jgi:glycosyltransferase involved in cell wall biosynthesis
LTPSDPLSRRVLIVAYYFPPMGFSGVQRVVKFCKYLPDFGWQPTVLTVTPGGYFAYDASLQREMEHAGVETVRTYSLDPTRLFGSGKTVPLPSENVRGVLARVSQWVFAPDNKVGWLPFAYRAGSRAMREGRFDAVFSSAPPYTSHLVAALLARRFDVPFVADFRDDWLDNPRHVYPTPAHRRLHAALERFVMRRATVVTAFNSRMAERIRARIQAGGLDAPVQVLPHGFDPDDFAKIPPPIRRDRMRLHYSGVFYDAQTPDPLFRAVAALVKRRPEVRDDIELSFVGLVPPASLDLARSLGIHDLVRYLEYLPHDRAVEEVAAADVLWTMVGRRPGSERVGTSKVYEYFGSRKPVLALAPEGVERDAVTAYPAGTVVDPDDDRAIAAAIEEMHRAWLDDRLPEATAADVECFDRRILTGRLAALLDQPRTA